MDPTLLYFRLEDHFSKKEEEEEQSCTALHPPTLKMALPPAGAASLPWLAILLLGRWLTPISKGGAYPISGICPTLTPSQAMRPITRPPSAHRLRSPPQPLQRGLPLHLRGAYSPGTSRRSMASCLPSKRWRAPCPVSHLEILRRSMILRPKSPSFLCLTLQTCRTMLTIPFLHLGISTLTSVLLPEMRSRQQRQKSKRWECLRSMKKKS
jgi:hypothetical protein